MLVQCEDGNYYTDPIWEDVNWIICGEMGSLVLRVFSVQDKFNRITKSGSVSILGAKVRTKFLLNEMIVDGFEYDLKVKRKMPVPTRWKHVTDQIAHLPDQLDYIFDMQFSGELVKSVIETGKVHSIGLKDFFKGLSDLEIRDKLKKQFRKLPTSYLVTVNRC